MAERVLRVRLSRTSPGALRGCGSGTRSTGSSLDTLARDLDAPLQDVHWVATGYLLALAAVIPITGWLATAYGPRRVYLFALVAFTAGSAL